MTTKLLNSVVIPDGTNFDVETILRAALYFDKVYVDTFNFTEIGIDEKLGKFGGAYIKFRSNFEKELSSLAVLRDAGVISPLGNYDNRALPPFSTNDWSDIFRQSILNSAIASPSSLVQQFTNRADFPRLSSDSIKNAASKAEVDIILLIQLASVGFMLDACANFSAVPLVDTKANVDFLIELVREYPALVKNVGGGVLSSLPSRKNALANRILEATLPKVSVKHPEDILDLRESLKDELQVFRAEVGRLASLIESEIWEEKFYREVEDIIAKDVVPAFATLQYRLKKPSKRILEHMISDWSSLAGGAVIPITAYVMQSAQLPWAILAGITAGTGIATLKTKVEEWSIKRDSALTFLLEANKKLTRRTMGKKRS